MRIIANSGTRCPSTSIQAVNSLHFIVKWNALDSNGDATGKEVWIKGDAIAKRQQRERETKVITRRQREV